MTGACGIVYECLLKLLYLFGILSDCFRGCLPYLYDLVYAVAFLLCCGPFFGVVLTGDVSDDGDDCYQFPSEYDVCWRPSVKFVSFCL